MGIKVRINNLIKKIYKVHEIFRVTFLTVV